MRALMLGAALTLIATAAAATEADPRGLEIIVAAASVCPDRILTDDEFTVAVGLYGRVYGITSGAAKRKLLLNAARIAATMIQTGQVDRLCVMTIRNRRQTFGNDSFGAFPN